MNWPEYNKNLIKRGNINVWLCKDIQNWWYSKGGLKKGRPLVYSDKAIETCLVIGYMLHMPLRMIAGFINAFFEREGLDLRAPSYT